ncbi:hypothetical protein DYB25_006793, partial [Aphanomyces astaci]
SFCSAMQNNLFEPHMSITFNNGREMVREEAEKAQRRQLAVEQWTLAKRHHHLRALVLFQGWRPWRNFDDVTIFRTKAIKAKHWHHDTTLRQSFGAWVGYRDARLMLQWQAQLCRLQVKREADAKRRVLHVWSCRVGEWRKEAAAKREKDRMWRQVQVWLADNNN